MKQHRKLHSDIAQIHTHLYTASVQTRAHTHTHTHACWPLGETAQFKLCSVAQLAKRSRSTDRTFMLVLVLGIHGGSHAIKERAEAVGSSATT